MIVTGKIHKSNSFFDGSIYGKIDSDEVFNLKMRRIMKIKSKGYPTQWFRGKFNQIKVKHGGKWWSMDELGKHLPEFDIDKEYV